MTNLDKLEALAKAATPGEWHRSERPSGPFWHIYADHTVDGKPCLSGKQSIGTMHAENKRTGSKAYAAMFEANASFVAAANPAAILELCAEVRRLRELARLQSETVRYADSVCGMLRSGGWPGKAEALEARIKAVIKFDEENQ
jgi:hypothetical protein